MALSPENTQLSVTEIQQYCQEAAAKWNVAADIHKDDFIFQFLFGHMAFPNRQSAIAYYFDDGRKSAEQLKSLLTDLIGLRFGSDAPAEILEFASGYGCVSRHFKNVMPASHITACDIHTEALTFVSEKLGVPSLPSSANPSNFNLGRRFDIVFALSFFSHMPDESWGRWLGALFSHVKPGGYLIFTTHGIRSSAHFGNPTLDEKGYWFRADSEQKDLPLTDYGSTMVASHYVLNQIFTLSSRPLLADFKFGYWWGHQDLYVLFRP